MLDNTQYFIIMDGQQKGPYPKEVLKMQGLTPETFVWREGMTGWEKASAMPELHDLFVARPPQQPYAGQPYGQPQQPYTQPYGQPQQPYTQPYRQQADWYTQARGPMEPYIPHTNWMPWAIVTTVLNVMFNCIGLIFSIIGIVQANKANRLYAEGWKEQADDANKSARTMTILGIIFCAIGILGFIFVMAGGYMSALSAAIDNAAAYD